MTDEIKKESTPEAPAPAAETASAAPAAAPAQAAPAGDAPRPQGGDHHVRRPYQGGGQGGRPRGRFPRGEGEGEGDGEGSHSDEGMQRMPRFRRKVCRFCHDKDAVIDYKNTDVLGRFITDRGKILPRRVTGTCSKHQRAVAQAIKRARIIALLPFVEQ